MTAQKQARSIRYRRVSLSVGYTSILFPFDAGEFITALPEQGFVLSEALSPAPIGARLDISGPIGRKGDATLRLNTERNFIAVDGPDPSTVVSEFDSLESFLGDRMQFDSQAMSNYYELLADLTVTAERSPLKSIAERFSDLSILEEMSKILSSPTTVFGIRLVPRDGEPTGVEWYDIRLEPRVQQAHNYYLASVVYRSGDRTKVTKFAVELEQKVLSLLAILGGG